MSDNLNKFLNIPQKNKDSGSALDRLKNSAREIKEEQAAQSGEILPPNEPDDYEYARENIKNLIEDGMSMLSNISTVAESDQNFNTYNSYTKALDTLIKANRELVDMRNESGKKETSTVTNNNLFVGSTQDVLNMLKSKENDTK